VTPAAALPLLAALATAEPAARSPQAPDGGAAPAELGAAEDRSPEVVVPVLHGAALMTVMRVTETFLWPDPFARTGEFGARYEEAFTKPPIFDPSRPFFEWDGDPWPINAIGHALFGSELYVRARQCRFSWPLALAFTAAGSVVWEYGFEANGVRPSALDLVYTPLAGIALGEARFALYQAAEGLSSKAARTVVRAVLDPLGDAERALGTRC
jgi:hypothetical protein